MSLTPVVCNQQRLEIDDAFSGDPKVPFAHVRYFERLCFLLNMLDGTALEFGLIILIYCGIGVFFGGEAQEVFF